MTVEPRDVSASSNIFWLIHGDTGVGRTTFIGTGAEMGLKTLIIRPPTDHVDSILNSGAKEIVVRDWTEIAEAEDYCRYEGHKWDWIWIDSYSLLQDIGLDDVYQAVVDSKGGSGGRRSMFGPDRGEYRVNMWRLESMIRHIVGSGGGFNLGVTAHSFWYTPSDDEAASGSEPVLMPWIQGRRMPTKICGMMNIVSYYELTKREVRGRTKEQRVMSFNKTAKFYAKCGFRLPDGGSPFDGGKLWEPTMPKFIERISEARLVTEDDKEKGSRRPSGTRPSVRPTAMTTAGRPSKRS